MAAEQVRVPLSIIQPRRRNPVFAGERSMDGLGDTRRRGAWNRIWIKCACKAHPIERMRAALAERRKTASINPWVDDLKRSISTDAQATEIARFTSSHVLLLVRFTKRY